MKKVIAIILSIFLITAPIYSYAVLPFVAAAAATMTRVIVGNTIKKPAKTAIGIAGMGILGYCKSSPQAMVSCGSLGVGLGNLISDIAEDWLIEETAEENGDINIEIYQIRDSSSCYSIFFYEKIDNKFFSASSLSSHLTESFSDKGYVDPKFILNDTNQQAITSILDRILKLDLSKYKIDETITQNVPAYFDNTFKYENSDTIHEQQYPYYLGAVKKMCGDSGKRYITNNEFYDYMQNNLTANDIKNIYNYDYSQHPNITINNNTTTGDTINTNLRAPNADDKTVSPNLKNDIENNNINMDDVNDQNCTKNQFGEYDQCGDTDSEPEDPTDPEPEDPTDPEPEPQPQICTSSEFTQTVCEFIAYMKGDFDVPDAQPVDVDVKQPEQSPSDFDKSYVEFGKVCPSFAPTDIEFGAGSTSFTQSLSIDIQVWCDFAEYINPVVEWAGRFIAFGIIAATIRNT